MKKIVATIVFAAVACASAFGSACAPVQVKETAWVYKWTFKGATTKPKAVKVASTGSTCAPAQQTCSVRVPASLKIQGYTMMCSPGCGDTFGEVAEVNEVFWAVKPSKTSFAGGLAVEFTHVIGKNKKTCEIAGVSDLKGDDMTYTFAFAGLGKYSTKDSRVKYAKGNFAGTAIPCECAHSAVWDCETLALACSENVPTVAYGKWNVKFVKKASKRYLKGDAPSTPRWVEWKNR